MARDLLACLCCSNASIDRKFQARKLGASVQYGFDDLKGFESGSGVQQVKWQIRKPVSMLKPEHRQKLPNIIYGEPCEIVTCGPEEIRTPDLYSAIVALSQLSYRPVRNTPVV